MNQDLVEIYEKRYMYRRFSAPPPSDIAKTVIGDLLKRDGNREQCEARRIREQHKKLLRL